MTATFDTVLQNALLLPVEDRSRIASRLIESEDAADDAELSPAWCAEIDRRIEAARSGASRRIPHAEVMADARHLLAQL
ncbi:MAG: addiction module protein [Prosthecobacter sp.]|uniref:addiction module protein n=1 Tax=Prosthecobacter sp. TaxID=1965333 RepID=UPI0039024C2A